MYKGMVVPTGVWCKDVGSESDLKKNVGCSGDLMLEKNDTSETRMD